MLAVTAGYELDVDRGPDWLWIRIRSVETGSTPVASWSEQVKELVEKHFIYRVVVELQEVAEPSSQFIGELVWLDQFILKHDGVLRICGLSAEGRATLEMCRLDDLCLSYETRDEAIRGMCCPHSPK
jgi:anti-anti-sigma regulatory factor